jgi:hypothetical protein
VLQSHPPLVGVTLGLAKLALYSSSEKSGGAKLLNVKVYVVQQPAQQSVHGRGQSDWPVPMTSKSSW